MNLIEFLQKFVDQQKRDIEFLHMQGWIKLDETCNIPGFTIKCNNVWQQPGTNNKYPQIAKLGKLKFKRAIDIAEEELLQQLHWKEVRIRIHDRDKIREESWYIHPKTKRLFDLKDAILIARYSYNDELIMCLLNNRINELVNGHRLKEGDLLCFDYVDGAYSLWR